MAFIVWDEKYSVGIQDIDNQHKQLIKAINDLHDAMKIGKSKDILKDLIDSLVNYADVHFSNEEALMSSHKYPELEEHKKKHKVFTEKINEFRDKFNLSSFMTSIEVMEFLKQWLMHHILDTDKQYSPYLKRKGVQ